MRKKCSCRRRRRRHTLKWCKIHVYKHTTQTRVCIAVGDDYKSVRIAHCVLRMMTGQQQQRKTQCTMRTPL